MLVDKRIPMILLALKWHFQRMKTDQLRWEGDHIHHCWFGASH